MRKDRPRPTVGQKVYLVRHGLHRSKPEHFHATVTRVGRKYFSVTVDPEGRLPWMLEFHVETWRERSNYTSDYHLFENEQDYLNERECDAIENRLRERLRGYGPLGLTLRQARAIEALLNDEPLAVFVPIPAKAATTKT